MAASESVLQIAPDARLSTAEGEAGAEPTCENEISTDEIPRRRTIIDSASAEISETEARPRPTSSSAWSIRVHSNVAITPINRDVKMSRFRIPQS
jgi:hypothetical protein